MYDSSLPIDPLDAPGCHYGSETVVVSEPVVLSDLPIQPVAVDICELCGQLFASTNEQNLAGIAVCPSCAAGGICIQCDERSDHLADGLCQPCFYANN